MLALSTPVLTNGSELRCGAPVAIPAWRRRGKGRGLILSSWPAMTRGATNQASDLGWQSGEHLVQRDRIVPDAYAARVVDRIRHRCAGAADAEFADAFAFQRVRFVVEFRQEDCIDIWNVGVHRHMILGQIVVHV